MRPIAIFQHDPNQRAGYLQAFLTCWRVPTVHLDPEAGDAVPQQARDFSGLVLLGSNRSVNDPLPWIAQQKALLGQALAMDIPVLGHCFGGQLLAQALGARVTRNPVPCIGWETLRVTPPARALFGGAAEVTSFNWHYETFAMPVGATRALFGTHCRNKGFTLGPHIGLQCHLEVTEDIVQDWCRAGAHELLSRCGPSVQPAETLLANLHHRLARTREAARWLYSGWLTEVLRRQAHGPLKRPMGLDPQAVATPVARAAKPWASASADTRIGIV
jgi:GMP synthase-like glutamine amidotransferase